MEFTLSQYTKINIIKQMRKCSENALGMFYSMLLMLNELAAPLMRNAEKCTANSQFPEHQIAFGNISLSRREFLVFLLLLLFNDFEPYWML